MALTFRTAGPWGAGKGSNLTPAEVDTNFYELQQSINSALSGLESPVGIDTITYDNGTVSFVLTDSTVVGPFDLPLAIFQWRGRYQGGQVYEEMDCFFHPALGGFLVLREHVTPTAFNPDLQIGGQPVYQQMFRLIPGGHLATRNEPSDVYTLALSDQQSFLRLTASTPVDLLLPNNSNVEFPIGSEVTVRATGQGVVFISGESGVTVNLPMNTSGLTTQGDVAYLKKVDTNEWDVWYGGASGDVPTEPDIPTETEAPPGNFFAEQNSEMGERIGFATDANADGFFGLLNTPILNGYTVRGYYESDGFYPSILLIEGADTESVPAELEVVVSGLGVNLHTLSFVSTGIAYYESSERLMLQSGVWYNLNVRVPVEANLIAEAGPNFGAVGYSENWQGEGSFGQIFNPIDGFTVRACFDIESIYPILFMVNIDGNTESPPAALAVTVDGLGTRVLPYLTTLNDVHAYNAPEWMEPFGFVNEGEYVISSIVPSDPPTEPPSEPPSEPPTPGSEPSERPEPGTGQNLYAQSSQFRRGYWEDWDRTWDPGEPPVIPGHYVYSVTPQGEFLDRDTSIPGWKVIGVYDRYSQSIQSPEVELLYDDVTEGWEPPTDGTDFPSAPANVYVRVTGESVTEGPTVRTYTLPWKARALVYPYYDYYGFAGTGYYDLFEFREGMWYTVEVSTTPF